jgi:hypothetical protein
MYNFKGDLIKSLFYLGVPALSCRTKSTRSPSGYPLKFRAYFHRSNFSQISKLKL